MSDRFKFRALYEGEWISPQLDEDGNWFHSGFRLGGWDYKIPIHHENVVQCTGLRDKNETLIFENDKVQGIDEVGLEFIGVVEWNDEDAGFIINLNNEYNDLGVSTDILFLSDCQIIEVIEN